MRPGATLGLSHGFLLGHMKNVGAKLPAEHQRRRRLPEGHGPVGAPAVRAGQRGQRRRHQRQLRRRSRTSTAARPTSRSAGRWRSARPTRSRRRCESEYKSDIYGERGILLGAVHGVIESALPPLRRAGDEPARTRSSTRPSRSPGRSRRSSRSRASSPSTKAWTRPARRSSSRRTRRPTRRPARCWRRSTTRCRAATRSAASSWRASA